MLRGFLWLHMALSWLPTPANWTSSAGRSEMLAVMLAIVLRWKPKGDDRCPTPVEDSAKQRARA